MIRERFHQWVEELGGLALSVQVLPSHGVSVFFGSCRPTCILVDTSLCLRGEHTSFCTGQRKLVYRFYIQVLDSYASSQDFGFWMLLASPGLPRYSSSYRRHTSASRATFFWFRTRTSCCRNLRSASIMLPAVMPDICRNLAFRVSIACIRFVLTKMKAYTLN